jgi:hypothetical protein
MEPRVSIAADSSDRNSLPLSYNQSAQLVVEWLAAVRGRKSPARSLVLALYIDGALNIPALQQALDAIVARHEVLRTSFPDPVSFTPRQEKLVVESLGRNDLSAGTLFTQRVAPTAKVPLSIRQPHGVGEDALSALIVRETRRPFDYASPPLMRATLVELDKERRLFLGVFHHLVADFWSLGVFVQELERFYNLFATGRGAELPELALQYGDFAQQQRRQLDERSSERAVAYWKQRWQEYGSARLKSTELPIAYAMPVSDGGTRWESVSLDSGATDRLRLLARTHRCTMYMACIAAMAIVFHAYTNRKTIAWWGYAANRQSTEAESLIGWFANGRVLGVSLDPGERALDVLFRVRRLVCDAAAYESIPLQVLWSRLGDSQVDALDDGFVALNVAPERRPIIQLADGVAIRPVPPQLTAGDIGRSLELWAIEAQAGVRSLACNYSTTWFEPSKVRAALDDIASVLAELASRPEAPVSTLAALTRLH